MALDWVKLREESLIHRLQIIKDFLEDNDINCLIVDKKDSAYQIGAYELYVNRRNVLKANLLIEKHLNFN